MLFKQALQLTAVGSSLFAVLATAGCGAMDPASGNGAAGTPEKGPPDNVEVKHSALISRYRSNFRAMRVGDHLFLSWMDNTDPATGQPGSIQYVYGMTMNDITGVGPTPMVLVTPGLPADWSDMAYDSVNDKILLAYNITYSASDHDVYAIRLDHNGFLLSSPISVEASSNDDYGSAVAFDPTASNFLIMWNRRNQAQTSTVMAAYLGSTGSAGAEFSVAPPNVTTPLDFGGITYAKSTSESRFVTTSDDLSAAYVSTIQSNQSFVATGRNLGNFYRGYVSFMASSNTVGIAAIENSTGGISFLPFNTNSCFPTWNCAISSTHIVDHVTGHNMDWVTGAVDGNFIVVADPAHDNHLKVVAVSPTGAIVRQRTYTASTGVLSTGAVVRGPTFNWIFWIDSNARVVGQKIDDQGYGGGETVIAN